MKYILLLLAVAFFTGCAAQRASYAQSRIGYWETEYAKAVNK